MAAKNTLWTNEETLTLVENVKNNIEIIKGSFSSELTAAVKQETWNDILNKYDLHGTSTAHITFPRVSIHSPTSRLSNLNHVQNLQMPNEKSMQTKVVKDIQLKSYKMLLVKSLCFGRC